MDLPLQCPQRAEGAGRSGHARAEGSLIPLPVDMVKGGDGVWTYTSAPQSPGYHNYWMFVDGAPVLDTATNGFIGYSHMCNGFEMPEPGVDWYDLKNVPHGDVVIKNYYAKSIMPGVISSSTRRRGMRQPEDSLSGAVPAARRWRGRARLDRNGPHQCDSG